MTRDRPRLSEPRGASAAGTLFVVATPIGNLEDITERALRVLREVDVVAAEDTRRTGNLLRHFGIDTPLVSLHQHNERGRMPEVLDRLARRESIALVSDAGTPGISDPGAEIVRGAREAGYSVIPVPGASSLTAILSVSGVTDVPISFFGFIPARSIDRKRWARRVGDLPDHAVVCFEAPHRLRKTLEALEQILGERQILLGREVTKVHEEWREGAARQLLDTISEPIGEFVLLIRPDISSPEVALPPSDEELHAQFCHLTETSLLTRRQAVQAVAQCHQMPVKAVYAAVERVKNRV